MATKANSKPCQSFFPQTVTRSRGKLRILLNIKMELFAKIVKN